MTMKIATFLCLLTVLNVQAMHIPGTDDVSKSDDTTAYFKQLFSQADEEEATGFLEESDRNDDNGWDQSKFEEAEEQLLDANNEVNGALEIILDLVIKTVTKWISQFQ